MRFSKRLKSAKGQGLTEYLVLVMLIAVVSIAAVRSLSGVIQSKFKVIRNHLEKDVGTELQD